MSRFKTSNQFVGIFFDSNRLDQKVNTRLNNIIDNYQYIFIDTLNPFLKSIKSNLAFDKLNGGVRHDSSGASSESTMALLTSFSTGGDDTSFSISAGIQRPGSINLELGTKPGTFVSLSKITRWADEKGISAPPIALQRSIISKGATAYPIVEPLWMLHEDKYMGMVKNRVRRQIFKGIK